MFLTFPRPNQFCGALEWVTGIAQHSSFTPENTTLTKPKEMVL